MGGELLFRKICLAADVHAAVAELDYGRLCELQIFLDSVGHKGGIVGTVNTLVTLSARDRFFAPVQHVPVSASERYPAGATTAEGLDSGLRGEEL